MTKKGKLARKVRPRWEFRLYVADTSPRSLLAMGNLRRLCEQHLKTGYRITIIDIIRQPSRARADNILATPTLVRALDSMDTKIIGTLTDTRKVLQALGVSAECGNEPAALEPAFPQIGHA